MTLISSWHYRAGDEGDPTQRNALVECDGCLPPRGSVGTAAELRGRGWAFPSLTAGPHRCPWCARRRGDSKSRRRWFPPEKHPGLPTFLVIGAPKCGTTSLHRYLGEHPEIHAASAKEVKFFHHPHCLDELDSYATFFDATAPVRGESSPIYALHPLAPGVPDRIHRAIPDVKLVYLVRDPVERVVSDYVQELGQERETRPFREAVGDVGDPYNRYVAGSSYATQIERYLPFFAENRILVVDSDELLSDRARALRRVFEFLGVDPDVTKPGFGEVLNRRDSKLLWSPAGRRLARSRAADVVRLLPPRASTAVFAPAKRVLTRRPQSPSVDPDLAERLGAALRPEADRFRGLCGLGFEGWSL